ncbi:MAG: DUF3301 domain-containing protein [Gammaproteobacteria bacterium]|nr:DUF3301 domain-containing protein [Gammaproteobacteria bacterium]MCF6230072.1 DUF3301 domain-containing protein [Gammaproteobacteria bacterium]
MDKEFLIFMVLVGLAVWFWLDSMRAHEAAVKYCKKACEKEGWNYLDQAVVLKKIWPRRNLRGRIQLRREYAFDYSTGGGDRQEGLVVMLGPTVQQLTMLSRD